MLVSLFVVLVASASCFEFNLTLLLHFTSLNEPKIFPRTTSPDTYPLMPSQNSSTCRSFMCIKVARKDPVLLVNYPPSRNRNSGTCLIWILTRSLEPFRVPFCLELRTSTSSWQSSEYCRIGISSICIKHHNFQWLIILISLARTALDTIN